MQSQYVPLRTRSESFQGQGNEDKRQVNLSSGSKQGIDTNKKSTSSTNIDSVCIVWCNASQRPLGNKSHVCFPFMASASQCQWLFLVKPTPRLMPGLYSTPTFLFTACQGSDLPQSTHRGHFWSSLCWSPDDSREEPKVLTNFSGPKCPHYKIQVLPSGKGRHSP